MTDDNFEAMLNETMETQAGIGMGEQVVAKVVLIGSEYLFLDLGMRAEGMVARDEFEKDGELTVAEGDNVEVFTSSSRDGAVICVAKMGRSTVEHSDDKQEVVARLVEAQEAGLPVEGKVTGVNKGGLDVSIFGLRGFCPVSQIDNVYCEDPSVHVGATYTFAISRVEGDRNIVVSRRQLLEKEAQAAISSQMETLQVGTQVEGEVVSVKPFGAFVRMGAVQGLIHISQLSHRRVAKVEEVVQVGQKVVVEILEIDRAKQKISLSLKSLEADPFDKFVAETTAGHVLSGTVARVVDFGAFVEVGPGIQGLLHVSAMRRGGERVGNPRNVMKVGDKVDVRVLEIDPESRKVSLVLVDHEADAEAEAAASFHDNSRAWSGSMGTLGDLFKARGQNK